MPVTPAERRRRMALIRPGAVVGQISGRVGGVVFARNRGGAYVRNGPAPVQPRTLYQTAVRNALSTASSAWDSITEEQRTAWSEWAKLNPVKNRIGESVTLQGNAAFVQLNSRLARFGIAPVATTPAVGAPSGLLTLGLNADTGAGAFAAVFTPTPLGAHERIVIEGCNVRATAVAFVENMLVLVSAGDAASASPLDIQAEFESRLGSVAVGDHLYIRGYVLDDRNGQISGMLTVDNYATHT
jgi:hypothetical protein